MSDAFSAATDAIFADPNIGKDALWRVGGAGTGIPCRVTLTRPDQLAEFGKIRVKVGSSIIEVRKSEIEAPAVDDTCEITGIGTFKIIAEPMEDGENLSWTCEAGAAT